MADIGAALRRATTGVVEQARRALSRGVALGEDARDLATAVRRWFSPWYAPRRGPTGALLRSGRDGGQGWPLSPGRAAMAARRLLMTETSRAHGEAVAAAALAEGMLVRWELAPSHPRWDECDVRAHHDSGHGPGVYMADALPPYPSHPACRCVIVPVGAAG